uniref:Uncharacterized protein n=1 Tax=Theropithecus gelada TaxID=9565 RepID=A0A8D2GIF8_THEGE
MDKFLLMLLLLGVSPLVFFQGDATMCMVCKLFKRGHCLIGKGNCTVNRGSGCRTRDFFVFAERGGWFYNHTELDCLNTCVPSRMYLTDLKVSTFCCKDQHFCNRNKGQLTTMRTD